MDFLKLIKLIQCFYLPILIYFINRFIINPIGIYSRWEWFDIPMHIIGGFAIVYSFILVLRKLDKKIIIKDRFIEILIIMGLFALVAIFWEFYEYVMHIIINVKQNSLEDTLLDFMFGLIGGLIGAIGIKVKK